MVFKFRVSRATYATLSPRLDILSQKFEVTRDDVNMTLVAGSVNVLLQIGNLLDRAAANAIAKVRDAVVVVVSV